MKIEMINPPKTLDELNELAKDQSIIIVYNVYNTLCHYYERIGKDPGEFIQHEDCFRTKSLHDALRRRRSEMVLISIDKGTSCLVKITP